MSDDLKRPLMVSATVRSRGVLAAVLVGAIVPACVTLPQPVYTDDLNVFNRYGSGSANETKDEAEGCAAALASARSSAKRRTYGRTTTTVLLGVLSATTSFVAATEATDDPDTAKTMASISLASAIVGVVANVIVEPSGAFNDHREGSLSWQKARRLANANTNQPEVYRALLDCRAYQAPRDTTTGSGTAIQ